MVLLKRTWFALILGSTQMSRCGEIVFCIRSSPKIKWNQCMRKVRVFGFMPQVF